MGGDHQEGRGREGYLAEKKGKGWSRDAEEESKEKVRKGMMRGDHKENKRERGDGSNEKAGCAQ